MNQLKMSIKSCASSTLEVECIVNHSGKPEITSAGNICFHLKILGGDRPILIFYMHATISKPLQIKTFGGKLSSTIFCGGKTLFNIQVYWITLILPDFPEELRNLWGFPA